MPYENEFAAYAPVKRLAESDRVRDLLAKHKIIKAPSLSTNGGTLACPTVTPKDLPEFGKWLPDYVLSIDGSNAEVPVDNGYPSSRAAYITVVSVLLKLKEMRKLDEVRPVDPRQFQQTYSSDPMDAVLPGANVTYEGELNPRASLRRGVIDLFGSYHSFDDQESVLDTYHELLKHKPLKTQNCPYGDDCGALGGSENAYSRAEDSYQCNCALKLSLHSTDALRFHERFSPISENGAVYSEIMQVLERIYLVNILRSMKARGYLNGLAELAVIMDGPLAVFGQPAWISRAIRTELTLLNNEVKQATGKDILIIGVEKSGMFVEHFEHICQAADHKAISPIEPQTAILLTNNYIKERIIFSSGGKDYGEATYFGRKILYKTKSGAKIVASLPFLADNHSDLSTAVLNQFPRLADALHLCDALVSSRYPNALIPVSLAHSQAAIPLKHGGRVLEKLARELIKTEGA